MRMSQIHLFAQGNGTPDWFNLAVPLAIVLISAIGGLIKRFAHAKQQGGRTGPAQPTPKAHTTVNWRQRLEQQLKQMQSEVAQRGTPEADVGQASSHDSFGVSQDARPTMAYTSERERVARGIRRATLQASEPVPEPAAAPSKPRARPASVPAVGKVLIDLGGPEALKRAVIQYEVLGKPLGLRDLPFEYASGRIY